MKRFAALLLALVCVFSLAACGAEKEASAPQAGSAEQKADISPEEEKDKEVELETAEAEIAENAIPLLKDDTGVYQDPDGVYEIPFGVRTEAGDQMFFTAKISANAILNCSGIDAFGEEDASLLSAGTMKAYNEEGQLKDISMECATYMDASGIYKIMINPSNTEDASYYFEGMKECETDVIEVEDENLPAHIWRNINDDAAIYITVKLSEDYYLDMGYTGNLTGSMDYKELAEKLYGLLSPVTDAN